MDLVRRTAMADVRRRLDEAPIVALLGARQVGKSTLARMLAQEWSEAVHYFDLEDPAHVTRQEEPGLVLRGLEGLVVLDEIQRLPELFALLRVLADRPGTPARFLVLGSAAPELVKGVSESLAGRVAFVLLEGFGLDEVGQDRLQRLWLRGGFPPSYLRC